MVCIFHKKISAIGWPVAEILIKYNKNNLEENDEEEKEPINIEITCDKADPYNDENFIDSKWSDLTKEDEEDIALATKPQNPGTSLSYWNYNKIRSK